MFLLNVRCFSMSNLNVSLSQNLSSLALKRFTFSHLITFSGSPFQDFTILSVKKIFLSFPLLFRVNNFFECPLVWVLVSLWRSAPEILWSYDLGVNLKVLTMSPLICLLKKKLACWELWVSLSNSVPSVQGFFSKLQLQLNIFDRYYLICASRIPHRRCVSYQRPEEES